MSPEAIGLLVTAVIAPVVGWLVGRRRDEVDAEASISGTAMEVMREMRVDLTAIKTELQFERDRNRRLLVKIDRMLAHIGELERLVLSSGTVPPPRTFSTD